MLRRILLAAAIAAPLGALAGDRGALNVQALVERLKLGNARFVANEPNPSDLSSLQRTLLTARQRPWCVVLGCSDARVPPEHIFSAGLGDLVTVRVAGNVADSAALTTIEYAVSVGHAPLLVVLGHSDCEAVRTFVEGTSVFPAFDALLKQMGPLPDKSRPKPGLDDAAKANVTFQVGKLARSEILSKSLTDKTLLIKAAFYDAATGAVSFLDEPADGKDGKPGTGPGNGPGDKPGDKPGDGKGPKGPPPSGNGGDIQHPAP